MKFCDKLQKLRKENNITQEGLADKLNVSRQAVSKWESGQAYPDTEKMIQISKIFKVSMDELVNDGMETKEKHTNTKLSYTDIFNQALEFISKTVNMFWSMKFSEKIKCLFEMALLILMIAVVALITSSVVVGLIEKIFLFLPSEVLFSISNLFESLLGLVWIVLGGIIVVRIFKTRYLDYYVFVTDDTVSKKTVEEPIQELKEKKEVKVVIRDPEDSSLNIFKKLGKVFNFIVKIFCLIMSVPLILCFIFLMVMLVFSLFYLFDGLFFNGITLAIVGATLFVYLLIEFVYNLLFNRRHAVHRIFLIFILSISFIGAGFGLSFAAMTDFTYVDSSKVDTEVHTIKMRDNLVLSDMLYNHMEDIVIDNSLTDIKVEITSYENIQPYFSNYIHYNDLGDAFVYVDIYSDVNGFSMYKEVIANLKERRIVNYDESYMIKKMYISEKNLTKLKENIAKYNQTIWE